MKAAMRLIMTTSGTAVVIWLFLSVLLVPLMWGYFVLKSEQVRRTEVAPFYEERP